MNSASGSSIGELQQEYRHSLDLLDLQLLLAHAAGTSREHILAHPEQLLIAEELERFHDGIRRRVSHEPIAHILGHKEFFGLDFEVTPATLIPRPETEHLVEAAMATILKNQESRIADSNAEKRNYRPMIIDVGTGSGNIIVTMAVSLRNENVDANLFGIDISEDALDIARNNARRHHVSESITFLKSDLLEPILVDGMIDDHRSDMLILANLPYLSHEIYAVADPDVRDYEPVTALVSDEGGLNHYRRLLMQVLRLCESSGRELQTSIFMEISPEQKEPIKNLVQDIFPEATSRFLEDYSGRPRVMTVFLPQTK